MDDNNVGLFTDLMFPNMEEEEKEGDNDNIDCFNNLIFCNVEEEEKRQMTTMSAFSLT